MQITIRVFGTIYTLNIAWGLADYDHGSSNHLQSPQRFHGPITKPYSWILQMGLEIPTWRSASLGNWCLGQPQQVYSRATTVSDGLSPGSCTLVELWKRGLSVSRHGHNRVGMGTLAFELGRFSCPLSPAFASNKHRKTDVITIENVRELRLGNHPNKIRTLLHSIPIYKHAQLRSNILSAYSHITQFL